MQNNPFAQWLRLLCAALVVATGHAAAADAAYPNRPVKVIVGFPAGSAVDVTARAFAERLGKELGQTFLIDNRPGAGAQIAAQAAARSPADGYTLLIADPGSMLVSPLVYRTVAYRYERDFQVISTLTDTPFVLATSANGPKSLAEFISKARSDARGVHMGTLGAGAPQHLVSELLGATAGFKVEPVHYSSMGDLLTGIQNGDVMATFLAPPTVLPNAKAGKMRGLAITSSSRNVLLPEVPTFVENKLADLDLAIWLALFAPAGTPPEIVERLSNALVAAGNDDETKRRLEAVSATIAIRAGANGARFLQQETKRWADIVKTANIKGM